MRQRNRGRATLAAVAVMCAVAALPGQAYAAGEPAPYTFDPEARTVRGAEISTDASALTPGSVYKSSIKPGEKLYYRIDLDAGTNAYVSAVAVPKLGGQVAYGDGITVSIRDSTDLQCSSEDARFESAEFPVRSPRTPTGSRSRAAPPATRPVRTTCWSSGRARRPRLRRSGTWSSATSRSRS